MRGVYTLFFISFFFVLEKMGTLFAMFFAILGLLWNWFVYLHFEPLILLVFSYVFSYYYFQAQQYFLFCLLVLAFTYSYVIMLICFFFFWVAVLCQHLLVIHWGLRCRVSHFLFQLAKTNLFLYTSFLFYVPLLFKLSS